MSKKPKETQQAPADSAKRCTHSPKTPRRCLVSRSPARDSHWNAKLAAQVTREICSTYEDEEGINHIDGNNMPQREEVVAILEDILEILFPGYTGRRTFTKAGLEFSVGDLTSEIFQRLTVQIERAFGYRCLLQCCGGCDCQEQAEQAVISLLRKIPEIRQTLKTDVQAAMAGDPAAKSADEIIIAYPCLKAIAVHRVAHELVLTEVPLVPRVMNEYAHAATGIDINSGATIGKSFFIDHGTGVVIGETAIIGENVKIYQGVTAGALSFPKDEQGHLIRGNKRHPTIEDNVTIYAGATILGDITIGHNSVIGGNVWLTESVPPHTKITIAPPDLTMKTRSTPRSQ